jgi:predicted secreted hydrolase
MEKQQSKLTVGELRDFLASCEPDTPITFGASTFRKRPLIFFRFHEVGEKLLHCCVNELDNASDNVAECECRITAGWVLRELAGARYTNDWEITFGSSMDAVPLEFAGLQKAVAIDLIQTQEPEWRVLGD